MKKLVLTGAAGRLGSILRAPMAAMCEELVSTDLAESVGDLNANETYVQANLNDLDAMVDLLKGAEMVVHFGAIGDEAPWDDILQSNIIGAYNIWEAAHRNKLRRVVYASSIHAVGMHKKTDAIGIDAPHKPDTYYGLAKCFAEDLASLYWDKNGIEAVCMRILSCAGSVTNSRAVGSWLSDGDMIHLVERAVDTPIAGLSVIYGVSNNDRSPIDNTGAAHLGYQPQDNAEQFAKKVFAEQGSLNPHDAANTHHGGPFAIVPLGESGLAFLNLDDD
ncbi:NAD(P)-dependent oxidoreductase [bacterium]|nr:NAD(P)-dependent oxidoreductase [bacterium]